jgi:hypothetical protein
MEPKITIKGQTMTIEIDLSAEGEVSKSGKSRVIASTHGNKKISTPAGEIVVGINVYKKA